MFYRPGKPLSPAPPAPGGQGAHRQGAAAQARLLRKGKAGRHACASAPTPSWRTATGCACSSRSPAGSRASPPPRCVSRIEEHFGWLKTTGNLRKSRYKGIARTNFAAQLAMATCNLIRMAKLALGSPPLQPA
jgi:hypothetical protein